jgi:hypothetical protein
MFRRGAVERLKRRATSEQHNFHAKIRAHDLLGALRHSDQQEQAITALIEREPDVSVHHFMLAGVLYNRSTVLDGLALGEAAITSARRSLDIYESFDPVRGAAAAVERQLRAMRSNSQEAERLIAHAADVRARLARLLAKYEGQSQAAAVHRHGKEAIATYEALVRFGTETTQADVERIRAQYKAAQGHLR